MATSKEYLSFMLDQFSMMEGISHRAMMGEYIIYVNGKVAGELCDNRFLVKITPSSVAMMPNAHQEPPYPGAKNMLLVENVDDREFLKELLEAMCPELPDPKKKRVKKS